MKTIKATCYTNLDNYDCTITNVFIKLPRKGDRVRVLRKGNYEYLKVHAIIHGQAPENDAPFIRIELHN